MTTLYNCPKCGTAMEPPTVEILPTREQLIAQLESEKHRRIQWEHACEANRIDYEQIMRERMDKIAAERALREKAEARVQQLESSGVVGGVDVVTLAIAARDNAIKDWNMQRARNDEQANAHAARTARESENRFRAEVEAGFRKHGLAAGPEAVDGLVRDLAAAKAQLSGSMAAAKKDIEASRAESAALKAELSASRDVHGKDVARLVQERDALKARKVALDKPLRELLARYGGTVEQRIIDAIRAAGVEG